MGEERSAGPARLASQQAVLLTDLRGAPQTLSHSHLPGRLYASQLLRGAARNVTATFHSGKSNSNDFLCQPHTRRLDRGGEIPGLWACEGGR